MGTMQKHMKSQNAQSTIYQPTDISDILSRCEAAELGLKSHDPVSTAEIRRLAREVLVLRRVMEEYKKVNQRLNTLAVSISERGKS